MRKRYEHVSDYIECLSCFWWKGICCGDSSKCNVTIDKNKNKRKDEDKDV